jgi:outer membrane lipoprotein SlyB
VFQNHFRKLYLLLCLTCLLTSCARDLSNSTYISSSTTNFTLEGQIIAARPVVIKEYDKLKENEDGILAGSLVGGFAGSTIGGGRGSNLGAAGGVVAIGILGALIESSLSEAKGIEYIVKVDVSKVEKNSCYDCTKAMNSFIESARSNGLITIVQSPDNQMVAGEKVYVIFSNDRARIVQAS